MTNGLAVTSSSQIVRTYDEVERAARAMAASGFFTDIKSISQAVVKIMAGQELGFGAFASMNGVYIIQGRPAVGANLMASAVKASGRYNYRVIKMTDKECEIAYFEGGQDIGHSTFTLEDAKKAGTKNLDKFPRNMLFARAMSNGVRWFCPDVMNGSMVYTPEELGADVDEEGRVIISVEPDPQPALKVEPELDLTHVPQNIEGGIPEPEPVKHDFTKRPYDADTLRAAIVKKAKACKDATEKQVQLAGMMLAQFFGDDTKCKEAKHYLFGVTSLKEADQKAVTALLNWMNLKQDSGGAYVMDDMAQKELNKVLDAYALESGQSSLFAENNQ